MMSGASNMDISLRETLGFADSFQMLFLFTLTYALKLHGLSSICISFTFAFACLLSPKFPFLFGVLCDSHYFCTLAARLGDQHREASYLWLYEVKNPEEIKQLLSEQNQRFFDYKAHYAAFLFLHT